MKRYLLLAIALFAIYLSHADTLRLMHYNLMQYSNNYSGCVSNFTAKWIIRSIRLTVLSKGKCYENSHS